MAEAFVRMGEDGLRSVLLAQACEEADPEGAFVPHAAREAASREAAEAGAEAGAVEAFLLARAGHLLDRIAAEHPAVGRLATGARFAPPTGLVMGGAFALGLAADALGRQRELNLLAFPLLGLLAWNLAVYAAGLVRRPSRQVEASRAGNLALAWGALRARLAARSGGAPAFLRRAATRFAGLWFERAAAFEAARWRARLHAGAAAFALGVVAGTVGKQQQSTPVQWNAAEPPDQTAVFGGFQEPEDRLTHIYVWQPAGRGALQRVGVLTIRGDHPPRAMVVLQRLQR